MKFPDASQRAEVKQRVGLTDIEIDYARPNKNDREIFGSLVPYGKIWRTGANATTRIKFSDTVKIGDKEFPAGEYGLFTIPNGERVDGHLFERHESGTADYKQENDAARVTVKPETLCRQRWRHSRSSSLT